MSVLPDQLARDDEFRHACDDSDPLWSESYYMDFTNRDGTLGGYVRISVLPNLGVSWYWGCVVREGQPLVTVIDHGVPMPKPNSLEIRTDGLWADHVVETPWDHFSLGLEAFAIAVDDPAEMYGTDIRGERVPLGFELDFDTVAETVFPYEVTPRYEIPCRVHGEILIGDETIDFDGIGERDHSWGKRDWWSFGWCWTSGGYGDNSFHHGTVTEIPGIDFFTGFDLDSDGKCAPVERFSQTPQLGREGLVDRGTMQIGKHDITVEPLLWSPVRLDAPAGTAGSSVTRFARALCRYTRSDGEIGYGWTEWNQPQ